MVNTDKIEFSEEVKNLIDLYIKVESGMTKLHEEGNLAHQFPIIKSYINDLEAISQSKDSVSVSMKTLIDRSKSFIKKCELKCNSKLECSDKDEIRAKLTKKLEEIFLGKFIYNTSHSSLWITLVKQISFMPYVPYNAPGIFFQGPRFIMTDTVHELQFDSGEFMCVSSLVDNLGIKFISEFEVAKLIKTGYLNKLHELCNLDLNKYYDRV